jgi:hypothetical protein
MADIIVLTETGHLYITPVGFLVYAKNYYSAGINWPSDEKYSPVPYFLFSRSIELGLKAFSLANGEKMSVLRSKKRVGHDLLLALENAQSYALTKFVQITAEEEIEWRKANSYYADKGFEYFEFKSIFDKKNLPDLNILQTYSGKLLENISQFVLSCA